MLATLKKSLGEGHAFISDEHGEANLYSLLSAMAGAQKLNATQATVATATLASMVATEKTYLSKLAARVGTTGTAGATTLQAHVNGASVAELTFDNTDADGSYKSVSPNVELAEGDLLELVVSAAPTAGADLDAVLATGPKVE